MSNSIIESQVAREYIIRDIKVLIRYWQSIYSQRDHLLNCHVAEEQYNRLREITFRVRKDAQKLSMDDVSNIAEWQKMVAIINQIDSLFIEQKWSLAGGYVIQSGSLYNRINEVEIVLYRLEHSPIRIRREEFPLLEIVESDLDKNNIFFEGSVSTLEEPGVKDFILLTFSSLKDEIDLIVVNEPAGEYILSKGKSFEETLDRSGFDELVIAHQDEAFDGGYMETGVIINEVDDETIYTKTMDGFSFNCNKLSTLNIPSTIGEYFLEQIDAPKHPYYIIHPTVADSDMSILLAVKEIVSLDDIYENLKKIMVDGYWVGMAYEENHQYFTLGYVDSIGYGTPFMVSIEEFRKLRMVHNDPFEA